MKTLYCLLFLTFFASCSEFSESSFTVVDNANLSPAEVATDLAVVSLTVAAEDFEEMYDNHEDDIEIDGTFTLYRNREKVIDALPAELEIKGAKSATFELKSLGVKFDDSYDNEDGTLIDPPVVLPAHSLEKIKAVRLRNSGNDFYHTMLKDLSYTHLAIQSGLDLDLTYGEPTLVFVNQEFYGLLNLRTESNTNGISRLYRADKDDITLAKMGNPELIRKDGDFDRIDRYEAAIYSGDIDYLKSETDLENFIDYVIFQTYIGNWDWPDNNVRMYAVEDGKFRFILYDLDEAAAIYLKRAPLKFVEGNQDNCITDLFNLLYTDPKFKADFTARYKEIVAGGTLSAERFGDIVRENAARIEVDMPRQIQKYGNPHSIIEWRTETAQLVEFFAEREAAAKRDMQ